MELKLIKQLGCVAFLIGMLAVTSHASVIAQSNWNNPIDGADGWSFVHDGSNISLVLTGGNGGGFLQITDQALGTTMYFVAPQKFLGNQLAAYSGSLSFDLQQSYDNRYYADDDVVLTGGGLTLAFYDGINPAVSPDWTTVTVPLVASAGWMVGTASGQAATEAQLQSVLSNLTAMWIRPEFQVGPDVDGIDNVILQSVAATSSNAVPEPGTILMGGIGLAMVALLRKRA